MKTKLFEVRDAATFIPIVAIQCNPTGEAERYLLGTQGYGRHPEDQQKFVLVGLLNGHGELLGDPNRWKAGYQPTMGVAHQHIIDNFDRLQSGDVVDAEYIQEKRATPSLPHAQEWALTEEERKCN